MSFVVVFLKRAKRFIVVQDTWVQDLLTAKLKNNGRNSNQDFLIFWSSINGVANFDTQPNFDAPLSSVYEETIDQICYIGRIIKFFDKFDDGDAYVKIRRPIEPPVYNEARVNEQPLPNILPPIVEQLPNIMLPIVEQMPNVSMADEQPLSNILPPICEQMPNISMVDEPFNDDQLIDSSFAGDDSDELDEPLMMVPTTSDLSDGAIDPLAIVIKEELEPLHNEDIQAIAEELLHEESQFEQFGDGLFMCIEGEMPLPMIGMNSQLKKDDVLSGKLLFIEHKHGERTYVIQLADGVCKRIFIDKKYVDVLIDWNKSKSGVLSQKYDIRFIRLLLLLSSGMGNLVNGELHDAVKQWVYDFFKIRVGNNLIRLLQFEKIVVNYIEELKKKI